MELLSSRRRRDSPALRAELSSPEPLVRCQELGYAYEGHGRRLVALDAVSFTACAGEFLCVVGPSGCGKTTLLKLLGGLLTPTSGAVRFAAGSAGAPPRATLVFQEQGLFPWLRVRENVAFALEARGVAREARRERAQELIARMGLAEFSRAYPHQLSTGMRQRVGLARALAADPEILLMDEPLASVDALNRLALRDELTRIWAELGNLVIYVTHDLEEAVLLGDRVLVLSGRPGRVLAEVEVPLPRPRAAPAQPEVARLAAALWEQLAGQVRRELCLKP